MYFLFRPIFKKCAKLLSINFLCNKLKLVESDSVHFFEDGTKLKIHSKIQPPLTTTNSSVSGYLKILVFSTLYKVHNDACKVHSI